ncbi:HAD family phosphatase [Nocardioides sp. NBC_00850]|uniref:HAD family hydrolase n=1 Tax=Nocardioides sp. NBC_00850 TaxID=2976001 RepID=UPI003867C2CF|nr:HAD family phosphatase [Nocardioides sp. NBC_00850]
MESAEVLGRTAAVPAVGETMDQFTRSATQEEDVVPGARRAVMFDFGGVLTTSLLSAFRAFGAAYGDPGLMLRLFGKGERGGELLIALEEGRIRQDEFEVGFSEILAVHNIEVEPDGLIRRMQAGLRPDPAMIELVASLRSAGRPVGLLSNSFGDDCYAGFDLHAMFDAVTISGEIGIRKPSRRAYRIACDNLGVAPEETVMIDDLEQNIAAAARVGIAGIVHRNADTTRTELASLLGRVVPA